MAPGRITPPVVSTRLDEGADAFVGDMEYGPGTGGPWVLGIWFAGGRKSYTTLNGASAWVTATVTICRMTRVVVVDDRPT